MAEYHPADEMRCPIHFCVGQEAIPAALSPLLRPSDVLMSHHRSHGYYLAKGGPVEAMVAEFYGRAAGANGGLAGSQELSYEACRFYSGTLLSGMFAMANGCAFAQKYRGTDDITVAVIGDGGMEEGIVFETLNLAAVLRLPILFICENNLYSAHTRLDVRSRSETLVGRAAAFEVPTALLDGNDSLLLHQHLTDIIAGRRGGEGPFFLEAQTYRICGHVGPENDDVLNYRPLEELRAWQRRDPVPALRALLLGRGTAEADLARLEAEVDLQVRDAIAAAKAAPFPSYDEAVAANWSGAQAAAAGLARRDSTAFDGRQRETRLSPY